MESAKRVSLKRVKDTAGDRVFNIINMVLMVVVCLVILYPLYFVIIASFSSPETVNGGGLQLLPKEFYLSGYKRIFSYMKIWQGYANSLYYTTLGTAINIAVTLPAAFALSRKTMRGRNAFMLLFSFTMFFGGRSDPYLSADQKHGHSRYGLGLGAARRGFGLEYYRNPHLYSNQHSRIAV